MNYSLRRREIYYNKIIDGNYIKDTKIWITNNESVIFNLHKKFLYSYEISVIIKNINNSTRYDFDKINIIFSNTYNFFSSVYCTVSYNYYDKFNNYNLHIEFGKLNVTKTKILIMNYSETNIKKFWSILPEKHLQKIKIL